VVYNTKLDLKYIGCEDVNLLVGSGVGSSEHGNEISGCIKFR
jgi:hypothetical protein